MARRGGKTMREMHVMVADVLSAELDALHRRHGPWRLLWALAGTIVRRSFSGNHIADLDDRMRRDMGLPEVRDFDDQRFRQQMEWKHYL